MDNDSPSAKQLTRLTADEFIPVPRRSNLEPLYVEYPGQPGKFRRWSGPTGRVAGDYSYAIYRLSPASQVEVRHPYYEHTLSDALSLAAQIKAGPLHDKQPITPKEALEVIREARKQNADFNWITGRVAEEVLRAANGELSPFTT